MKVNISKMASKGATMTEILIGVSIAIGMLAATLHIGTELQRKSSWEEEALTLHTIGTQIMQTFEEKLLNAGHGFGSNVLLGHIQNAHFATPYNNVEHRYAVDVFPCGQLCQAAQNYGPYKNMSPENSFDEIHTLAMAPHYIRSVIDRIQDPSDQNFKWIYILEKAYANFEWELGWIYAVADKGGTWGCAGVGDIGKQGNQDSIGFSSMLANYPCQGWSGEFWQKDNHREWRIGPLNGFAARMKFDTLGPSLEFSRERYFPTVAAHGSGRFGSTWEYPWHLWEWLIASRSVLSFKAALGIPDPQNPHQVLWFPDTEKNHPYIAMCDENADPGSFTRCVEIVKNRFGGIDTERELNYRHALMRRVRAVRLSLIVQSKRADARKAKMDNNGAFVANPDGTFKNGRLTKRFERTIWPPNLQEMKAIVEEESEEEE